MQKHLGTALAILLHISHPVGDGSDGKGISLLGGAIPKIGEADTEVGLIGAYNGVGFGINLSPYGIKHPRNRNGRSGPRGEGNTSPKVERAAPSTRLTAPGQLFATAD